MASDNPQVLSWPWEALIDPQVGDLAHLCRIERQLDSAPEPLPLPENLPKDRVHILLVTARPYQNDIAYRSITRPLVELIQKEQLPAEVKVLRPPTFEQLRRELQEQPGRYHIVHFDGHGGFGQVVSGGAEKFKGPQGQLLFENADGGEDAVTATQLSHLLREHRIPIAVLNACQSAMLSEQAEDAFASVATALLRAGVRSVVAMGYSLYVSGARQFLPAFYRQLFRTGDVAEATRSGRQAMRAKPQRIGNIELQDWLVPVLYQQDPLRLTFAAQTQGQSQQALQQIPPEARVEGSHAPHGVIGRDSAVLALERASRRPPPALLLHGLGGIGKTTLARGYIEWLAQTQGLPQKVLWQNLADVRSFDYLRNRLVEELFGTNAMALPDEQKWPALTQVLRQQVVLIVWDNFESASGMADGGSAELHAMPASDRQQLKQWLEQLRGGASRVLITSRSDESWLGTTACYRVPMGGLQGEERQELAQAILADQGLRLNPSDEATAELIDSLQGHPLMMRAILPRLRNTTARQLKQDFEQYVPQADSTDPVEQRLYATLRYVEQGLPEPLRPLLHPIGLHEGHVVADFLADISERAGQSFELAQVEHALKLLEAAGLVRGVRNRIYEMHPAFERYARVHGARRVARPEMVAAWERGFYKSMAQQAQDCASGELHMQRQVFALLGGSFERALDIAQNDGNLDNCGALLQAQGAFAQNRGNLPLAAQKFEAFAENCKKRGREDHLAAAQHQLGIVFLGLFDYDGAEAACHRSLEISESLCVAEKLTNEEKARLRRGAAATHHQLGRIAAERPYLDQQERDRNLSAAEHWCLESLRHKKAVSDEEGIAMSYHQLGIIKQKAGKLPEARSFYMESVAINVRLNHQHALAKNWHQLGMVAKDSGDLDTAEMFYDKALEVKALLHDPLGSASTHHELGIVAQLKRNWDRAEASYFSALAAWEHHGETNGAANTLTWLGRLAEQRGDFDSAQAWWERAAHAFEKLCDQRNADIARSLMARLRGNRSLPPDVTS